MICIRSVRVTRLQLEMVCPNLTDGAVEESVIVAITARELSHYSRILCEADVEGNM
jgi:hypothetical protein